MRKRLALVTGANTGIGRQVAISAVAAGWKVVAHWFEGNVEIDSLCGQLGEECTPVRADLRDISGVYELYNAVDELDEPLGLVVNNAGLTGWTPDVLAVQGAEWDAVFGVNARATYFSSLEAYRRMQKNGRGSIVNVSSNTAALAIPQLSLYGASKAAINALTRLLSVEFAPGGVRINSVAPGPTVVERTLRDDPDYETTWAKMVPLGRAAHPDDISGPILFLASDAARYITGQVIYVDGGWSQVGVSPSSADIRPGSRA